MGNQAIKLNPKHIKLEPNKPLSKPSTGRIVLCRWTVNDLGEQRRFCGRAISKGKRDYCDGHWARLPFWPQ